MPESVHKVLLCFVLLANSWKQFWRKDVGKNNPYQTTAKHNSAIVCLINVKYYAFNVKIEIYFRHRVSSLQA